MMHNVLKTLSWTWPV